MNRLKIKQMLVMAMLLPLVMHAQTDSTSKTNKLMANVSYQTKLHYFGRTDNLQSSGLFPSIGFELKEGLYATGNFIFIQNDSLATSYTGTTIEGGYRFSEGDYFTGNIFYTQFLYRDKSVLVQSALKSQTGFNAAYTNKIVNLNIGADLKFSDKTDVGTTVGLDHLFIVKLGSGVALAFNPSAYAYAGTQNFTNTYLTKQSIPTGPLIPPTTQYTSTTTNVTKFNVLAYEFSVPIVFVLGKLNASITPAFVMPQNIITDASNPTQSEKGSNMFYATFGIGVRL